MYYCYNCKSEFEELEMIREPHGEELPHCPCCGSEVYEEMQKCVCCGEYYIGDAGRCSNCNDAMLDEFETVLSEIGLKYGFRSTDECFETIMELKGY